MSSHSDVLSLKLTLRGSAVGVDRAAILASEAFIAAASAVGVAVVSVGGDDVAAGCVVSSVGVESSEAVVVDVGGSVEGAGVALTSGLAAVSSGVALGAISLGVGLVVTSAGVGLGLVSVGVAVSVGSAGVSVGGGSV